MSSDFWENAFAEKELMWGKEPTLSAVRASKHFHQRGVRDVLIPGIGYGRNARPFLELGMRVTGIEVSVSAIALARDAMGLTLPIHQGSVTEMPYDDAQYDGIFCYGLLYLLERADREKLLRDCLAQLRPGGQMIFTVVSKDVPLPGGGQRLIYDEDSIREEIGPYGMVAFERTDEPNLHGGTMPFFNVLCERR
jgi:SAM-dependent methyltransferase